MFGLGWMELLIIFGAVSLLAGPVAMKKLVRSARELERTKNDLTGPGALKRFLLDDEADESAPRSGDDGEPPGAGV